MGSFEVQVPADIVYDILVRLPAKSLLRFRSISKNWRDIIDDSLRFSNMHMTTRLAAADEPQLLPLCNYIDAFDRKRRAALTFDGNIIKESDCPSPILDFSKRDHYYVFVEFVAYGLLLLQDCWAGRNRLFLCNPLRGEVLDLPKPLQDCSKDFLLPRSLTSYGIGFDSTTNSYKIVRLGREPRNNLEIEVYTLGTHSWRHASPSSISRSNNKLQLQCLSEFGVSAYGDMHWKNWEFGRDHEARIISFDFKNEQLKETPLPDFGCQGKHYRRFQLINLKGFLAVVSFQSDRHIEIWMLKDYYEKIKESWVREYRISTQVWERGSDPDHNGLIRSANISFWREPQQFEIGVSSHGLLFVEVLGRQVFVLDLQRNCLWHLDYPQSYEFFKKITTIFSYTGGVFSPDNLAIQLQRNLKDCRAGGNKLLLCNPLRREVLELPKPLKDCSKDFLLPRNITTWYGIGFDSSTNSYKIVRLCRERPSNNPEIEVYTFGTHSWRDVSSNKHQLHCLSEFGLVAHGDVHWRDLGFGSDYKACIIPFDFKNDQLHETSLPNFRCQLKHYRKLQLTNLEGFLAVVSFQSDSHIKM